MARITFEDKIALEEQGSIAEVNKITADNINEIKTAINSLENDFLPLTGGTLRGDLSFSHTNTSTDGHITWTQGTYWQRLKVVDSSSNTATLFAFQRSSDNGETFNNIATLSNDGIFTATKLSGEVLTTKITGDTVTFSGAVKVTSGLTASTVNGYALGNASSKTIRGLSSASHSNWANLDTDSKYVPDMTFIAYWNGAYNSSGNSNLQYCDRGRFGTIVTKGSGDYLSVSGGNMNGEIKGNSGVGLLVRSNSTGSWKEGLRIYPASNNFEVMYLGNENCTSLFSMVHNSSTNVHYFDVAENGTTVAIHMPFRAGTIALTDETTKTFIQSAQPTAWHVGDIWFS